MFPKKDKNQQVLQEIFHLGRVSLEITPGFKWWQCFNPLVFRVTRVLSSKIYTSHFFKWYWRRIDIMCMHIYIYAYIQNSMTVVDTNFVALAAVFTISWLEAGWCFGFCRSSVFVFIFWENNQPSENPSPNHPPFPAEERTSIVWCTSSNVWIISPPPLSSPGAKIWVKSCGFFSVGGSCLCRKVLFQGGWEIKLTSDDFLWNDVFLFFL